MLFLREKGSDDYSAHSKLDYGNVHTYVRDVKQWNPEKYECIIADSDKIPPKDKWFSVNGLVSGEDVIYKLNDLKFFDYERAFVERLPLITTDLRKVTRIIYLPEACSDAYVLLAVFVNGTVGWFTLEGSPRHSSQYGALMVDGRRMADEDEWGVQYSEYSKETDVAYPKLINEEDILGEISI